MRRLAWDPGMLSAAASCGQQCICRLPWLAAVMRRATVATLQLGVSSYYMVGSPLWEVYPQEGSPLLAGWLQAE